MVEEVVVSMLSSAVSSGSVLTRQARGCSAQDSDVILSMSGSEKAPWVRSAWSCTGTEPRMLSQGQDRTPMGLVIEKTETTDG